MNELVLLGLAVVVPSGGLSGFGYVLWMHVEGKAYRAWTEAALETNLPRGRCDFSRSAEQIHVSVLQAHPRARYKPVERALGRLGRLGVIQGFMAYDNPDHPKGYVRWRRPQQKAAA